MPQEHLLQVYADIRKCKNRLLLLSLQLASLAVAELCSRRPRALRYASIGNRRDLHDIYNASSST